MLRYQLKSYKTCNIIQSVIKVEPTAAGGSDRKKGYAMMKALNKKTVIKIWGILVVVLVALGSVGATANASSVTTVSETPTAVRGTWYTYDKASGKTGQLVITQTLVGTTSGKAARMMNVAMCSRIRVSTAQKVTTTQLKRGTFNRIYVVKSGKITKITTNDGAQIVRKSKNSVVVKYGNKTLTFYKTRAQARAAA